MLFTLIKQVFIALLSFSGTLVTKCVYLSNEPCMTRPTLIDLNPIKLNCYLSIISPDKYNGSCNVVDDLPAKICVPSETEDVNVKAFNTITRISESKTLVIHFSCDCKCKFNNTVCNSNQK